MYQSYTEYFCFLMTIKYFEIQAERENLPNLSNFPAKFAKLPNLANSVKNKNTWNISRFNIKNFIFF